MRFVDKLLSTCLRSKPLLARGQRALRAYDVIGEWLFVQARQPIANIAKLLCSFLCPLARSLCTAPAVVSSFLYKVLRSFLLEWVLFWLFGVR